MDGCGYGRPPSGCISADAEYEDGASQSYVRMSERDDDAEPGYDRRDDGCNGTGGCGGEDVKVIALELEEPDTQP